MIRQVCLVASGDSRPAANRLCWPAQAALEARVDTVFGDMGCAVRRGHPVDAARGHGFLEGQAHGIEVFRHIDEVDEGAGLDATSARRLAFVKAGMAKALGIRVNLCGDIGDDLGRHQAPECRA